MTVAVLVYIQRYAIYVDGVILLLILLIIIIT